MQCKRLFGFPFAIVYRCDILFNSILLTCKCTYFCFLNKVLVCFFKKNQRKGQM